MKSSFKIGEKLISKDSKPYFIADIGANHDGDLNRAFKLIELAKECGADAAKFQNFKAHKIVSKKGFKQLGGKLAHQSNWNNGVYEVYQQASIPHEWTREIKDKCNSLEIDYFTSPYDFKSVDEVDPYVDVYKVGSGDITWLEIIEYILKKNKPIIIASGASDISDVDRAIKKILKYTDKVVLMQCNTNYSGDKSNFNYINLNVLKTFESLYPNVVLGLSDHTVGDTTVLGAISLGARVIEKHFTDDNSRSGPDHKFAMNPESWKKMIQRSSELFLSLGDGIKRVEENEYNSKIVQRRSIRCNVDLLPGEIIKEEHLEFLRPLPVDGIEPYLKHEIIGKLIVNKIQKGDHFSFKNISNDN